MSKNVGKTVRLAVFKYMDPGSSISGFETFDRDSAERDGSHYVRISEYAEVSFQPLKNDQVIQGTLRALDAAELKAREDMQRTLDRIKDQRAQLLQLTHIPAVMDAPSTIPTECPKCGPSCQCDPAWNE